jgi:hypothetical protein
MTKIPSDSRMKPTCFHLHIRSDILALLHGDAMTLCILVLSCLLTPKGINPLAWFTPSNSDIEEYDKRNKEEKNMTTPSFETFLVFVRKERYSPPNLSPHHADE